MSRFVKINKKHSIKEQDPLDSELRILDRIFYKFVVTKLKSLKEHKILDKEQTSNILIR
jgi:hypothetical protein